jgi:hypothetical protein
MGARINMESGQFNEDRLEKAINLAIGGGELESFKAFEGDSRHWKSELNFECRHVFNFTLTVGYSRYEKDGVGKTHAWVVFGAGCFDSGNVVKRTSAESAMAMFFKLFDYEQPADIWGGRIPEPPTFVWPAAPGVAAPALGDSDAGETYVKVATPAAARQQLVGSIAAAPDDEAQQPQQKPDASVWQPTTQPQQQPQQLMPPLPCQQQPPEQQWQSQQLPQAPHPQDRLESGPRGQQA